jgi:hypothetical protein
MTEPKRAGTLPVPETQPFHKTFGAVTSPRLPRELARAVAAGVELQPVSPQELRAKLRLATGGSTLDVSAGAPSKVDLTQRDHDGSRMKVRVADLRYYDGNPRESLNENFAEIKEGLRAVGFAGSMVVTRRPNEEAFMLAFGSNSTLRAMKELWEETREPRFEWVECVLRAYRGEAWLLANHLIENNNRGALTFWDNARGTMRLKAMLEAEAGTALSFRDLEGELRKRGLSLSRTILALHGFATERLAALGSAASALSIQLTEDFRSRSSTQRKLASLHGVSEIAFWQELFDPALREGGAEWDANSRLDAASICAKVESALAARAGESLFTIREMLALLARDPGLTLADLRRPKPPPTSTLTRPVRGATGGPEEDDDRDEGSTAGAPDAADAAADNLVHPFDNDSFYENLALPPPNPRTVELLGGDPDSIAAGIDPEGVPPPALPRAVHGALNAAVRLARACRVADCLRYHADAPLGYYMEMPVPSEPPVPLNAVPEDERHARAWYAWWLLAEVARQFITEVRLRLPADSAFVHHWSDEQAYMQATYRVTGVEPHRRYALEWLLDVEDETSVLLLDLLRLARLARAAEPGRWPETDEETIFRE